MKICVYKTSDSDNEEIREFSNLEEAVNTLLKDEEAFGGFTPELVISKPGKYSSTIAKDCDFMIEIYDAYRE